MRGAVPAPPESRAGRRRARGGGLRARAGLLHARAITAFAVGLLAGWLACSGSSRPPPAPPPVTSHSPAGFSGDLAFRHLEALAGVGPRVTGTRGAARARHYLRDALNTLRLPVFERRVDSELGELVHVETELPGEGEGWILLATHYDTRPAEGFRFVGANDGASGPALLLELARVLARKPRTYGMRLVFLDGDAGGSRPADPFDTGPPGSRALVAALAAEGRLDSLRLAVYFDQVGDADLAIARDLRSSGPFRDLFFRAAERMQRGTQFPADADFEAPFGGHLAFLAAGVRRVVAIVDNRFGGERAPGLYAYSEDDVPARCAPASLKTVGAVSLEALELIQARLDKIDRFVESPITEPREESGPLPTPGAVAPASGEGGGNTARR